MNIYVGNISYDASDDDLKEAFGAFGEIQSATIIKDKYTGDSKGFGFVEMPSKEEGQAAIDGLHDTELKGRNLTVNEARPRNENRGGGGGFGGGGGGGGRGGYGGGGHGGGGGGFGGGGGGRGGNKRQRY